MTLGGGGWGWQIPHFPRNSVWADMIATLSSPRCHFFPPDFCPKVPLEKASSSFWQAASDYDCLFCSSSASPDQSWTNMRRRANLRLTRCAKTGTKDRFPQNRGNLYEVEEGADTLPKDLPAWVRSFFADLLLWYTESSFQLLLPSWLGRRGRGPTIWWRWVGSDLGWCPPLLGAES